MDKAKRIIAMLIIANLVVYPIPSYSLPQGGLVGAGTGSISSSGSTMNVNQASDRMVVDWDSFSVSGSETVNFNQLSTSAAVLNRVRLTGGTPSEIFGTINANGQVFLINGNGIVFAPGSHVNVAGLVASSLDISNTDFMNGNLIFSGQGSSVINYSDISVPGGFVALLGSRIENVGSVIADLGTVILASGEAMTLGLDAQGIMNVVVDSAVSVNSDGKHDVIKNTGTVKADGGTVIVNAQVLDDIFDHAINNEGIIEAKDFCLSDGEVILVGSDDVRIANKVIGGDVSISSINGDVVHYGLGDVYTEGGDIDGYAGNDYILRNGSSIITENGIVDVYAKNDIVLGVDEEDEVTIFDWKYLNHSRGFYFEEWGYYFNENGVIEYQPIVQGYDIGKDSTTPRSGSGVIYTDGAAIEYYTHFRSNGYKHSSDTSGETAWTYHSDPTLNDDGEDHMKVIGDEQGWEDIYGLGDRDWDDAVLSMKTEVKVFEEGPTISSNDKVFITADQGSITQKGGIIQSSKMMLSANKGISGEAENGGLTANVDYFSAENKSENDIRLSFVGNSVTAMNTSGFVGINSSVRGTNGVVNDSMGGKVDIASEENLILSAHVYSQGDIILKSGETIQQTASGDVVIAGGSEVFGAPINVRSTSHNVDEWTNKDTVDVVWNAPESENEPYGNFYAEAGNQYVMNVGAKVETNGGDVDVVAQNNVSLSLIDAGSGEASVTSVIGNIVDADLFVAPNDYDVIAAKITLSAPQGSVGSNGAEEEIDLGHPDYKFSYVWDELSVTNPDIVPDEYDSYLTSEGVWEFATSYQVSHDSANWWFHVATVDFLNETKSSSVHLGPFLIDTTAPVISAIYESANEHGWYNHDVDVVFVADDNLSGFVPEGSLHANMGSKTSMGEGIGLRVTSDGIVDRAGNIAKPIEVAVNVDKTAPVISAGDPMGVPGEEGGTYASDVMVPFSADDNLSGFAPSGALHIDMDSKISSGEGNVVVTSDGIFDLAGNFTPGIDVGLKIKYPGGPEDGSTGFIGGVYQFQRVYYEILSPSQFLGFEPATPIGVYAYHPLTETDTSAFDEIKLETEAFEFIEENLNK